MTDGRYAAFLRNVNLGRPGSPTRAQLESAFLQAGAASAVSFQVNGTLVFTPARGTRPRALAARACALMRASCGMREPVFVRSLAELQALVASDPFAEMRVSGLERCTRKRVSGLEICTAAPRPMGIGRACKFQDLTPSSETPSSETPSSQTPSSQRFPCNVQDLTPSSSTCCITFLGAPRRPLPALPIVTPRGDLELLRSDDTHVLSVSHWVGSSGGSPNAWLERHLGEPATTRNWRTVVRLVEKHGRTDGILC